MRVFLTFAILSSLANAGWCFEGTPNPKILDGLKFDGWVKVADGDQTDHIQCGEGELRSGWASDLGFAVLKWTSDGEITGSGEAETLSFETSATNKEKSQMVMRVKVVNRKALTATIKILKADGKTEEHSMQANVRPKYLDNAAYTQALKECRALDLAVKEAPKHYIPPDPAVEKMLEAPLAFTAHERPLHQILDWLSDHLEVLVYSDLGDFDHSPIFTITDAKTTKEVLEQMCKQKNYAYVVRGHAIVLTYPDRAAKLHLKPDDAKQK